MLLNEIAPNKNSVGQKPYPPGSRAPKIPAKPLNHDLDPEKAIERLLSRIDFQSSPAETEAISKRLRDRGIDPTVTNVKRYLVKCMTIPVRELPNEERSVIVRSGSNGAITLPPR